MGTKYIRVGPYSHLNLSIQYLPISSLGPTLYSSKCPLFPGARVSTGPISVAHYGSWAQPLEARDTIYNLALEDVHGYKVCTPCCTTLLESIYFPSLHSIRFFFFNMSRLPTPAMSGGFTIKDKPDGDTFTLPPAALSNASRRSSRSDPSYVPASPTSPELSGRRTSHTSRSGTSIKRPLEDFDLPPPPTRTRKIIQMKPKSPSKAPKTRETAKGSQSSEDLVPNPTSNSKRKQPSATSAAGRKIARKTAHSLIERRRRSKMNEEFGTLKDMIPACTGQEMHKLAILQVRHPHSFRESRIMLTIPTGKH